MFQGAGQAMQVTNNALMNGGPSISANHIVWEQGTGNNVQVISYDGMTTSNLSQNSVVNQSPRVDGNSVVWVSGSTPNSKIMLYNGTVAVPIAASSLALLHPAISGQNIAWDGFAGTTANDSTSVR